MKAVLPFVMLLGLAACGREPDAPAAANNSKPAAASRSADDSVAAVAQSPGKPAISLRFALDGKPKRGAASQLRLDLAGVPGPISVRLQGEGLALDPQSAAVTIPDDGKPARQLIAITPQAAGLSEIVVRVQQQNDGAQEILYAIPLLVEDAAAK
jgi:hypothetical protein